MPISTQRMRRARGGVRRHENTQHATARTRFGAHLGAWHHGWTRAKNLTLWLTRAVRASAAELGLRLDPDGTVCGDHLVAVINRALQTLAPWGPQYDTEFPPLTVDELRRLIAHQPPGARQLHYAFEVQTGYLRVGCFHGYATTLRTAPRTLRDEEGDTSMRLGRAQLECRVNAKRRGNSDEDLEAWLLHRLATQPLDALHLTHRFVLGELRLTRHVPPLVYRPAETPLLLDEVGAPFMGAVHRRALPTLRLYAPLAERHYDDVVFHDTVAAHVGGILERGLLPAHGEVYLWSWATAPARGRKPHDARFYVRVRQAVREGGLRFFMSDEGSILCPSPIPMRFLELAEEEEAAGPA